MSSFVTARTLGFAAAEMPKLAPTPLAARGGGAASATPTRIEARKKRVRIVLSRLEASGKRHAVNKLLLRRRARRLYTRASLIGARLLIVVADEGDKARRLARRVLVLHYANQRHNKQPFDVIEMATRGCPDVKSKTNGNNPLSSLIADCFLLPLAAFARFLKMLVQNTAASGYFNASFASSAATLQSNRCLSPVAAVAVFCIRRARVFSASC